MQLLLSRHKKAVITGLDPVIHVFLFLGTKNVDGRDRPRHDEPHRYPRLTGRR
jgi:hypothetical protein